MPKEMRLGRIFTSLFAAAVAFTATTASAANVVVSTHSLGAGGAAVASCGSGFGVTYNLGVNNVVASVTITDIPSTCNDGMIRAIPTDNNNVAQGSGGSVSAGTSGSATVSLGGSPQAENVKKVFIVIEGGQA